MPRVGLTKAAVVDAAAELVDATGREVTLAELASHLGIRAPSLYNHVEGQEGLRRELALRSLREMGRRVGRAAAGRAGDEAVTAVADAYRRFAREHPGLYAVFERAPAGDDPDLNAASAELVDIVVAVLGGYGLSGDDALHATRGLRSLVHGFVSLEALGGFGLPLDVDESFRRLVRTFVAGLRAGAAST